MDLALALLVFVLLGWALDNWLGTKPLFIIVFAVMAIVGGAARLKYSYDEAMERHERERAEAMRATVAPQVARRAGHEHRAVDVGARRRRRRRVAGQLRHGQARSDGGTGADPDRRSVIWGSDGAWSSSYAIGLVLVNFMLSALLIGWAARISLVVLMAAAMFGYLFRLGLIFLAVFAGQGRRVDFAPGSSERPSSSRISGSWCGS